MLLPRASITLKAGHANKTRRVCFYRPHPPFVHGWHNNIYILGIYICYICSHHTVWFTEMLEFVWHDGHMCIIASCAGPIKYPFRRCAAFNHTILFTTSRSLLPVVVTTAVHHVCPSARFVSWSDKTRLSKKEEKGYNNTRHNINQHDQRRPSCASASAYSKTPPS